MKILFATGAGETASHAQRLLATLADPESAEVTVLAVASFELALQDGVAATGHYSAEVAHKRALAIVDESVQQLAAEGFSATGRTEVDDPATAILRILHDDWFDVTVMGSGERGRVAQMLGSVSTRVLHESPTSVLVVHDIADQPRRRVVMATDGSRGAHFAMESLAQFLKRDVGVTVVTIGDTELERVPESGSVADAAPEAWSPAERVARSACTFLEDRGFETRMRVERGRPVDRVLDVVTEEGADLVAVGSRGRGALRRVLLGSVSDNLARLAPATLVGRRAVI
jgi:nucleotide-binding universal stress UspA family protein